MLKRNSINNRFWKTVVTVVTAVVPAVAVLAIGTQPVWAVSTRIWVNATYADFDQGKVDGAIVDSEGTVRRGFNLKRNPLKGVSMVFSILELGGRVYLGTGDEGQVWVASGGRVRKLVSLKKAVLVTCLEAGPKGVIYAGTLPDGKIFKIDTATGKASVFATVKAKHVWDLDYDRRSKTLMAATGPKGKLFRITANGKSTVYWSSEEKHLLSLTRGPGGALYVGSAPKAIVYRILGKGRARAVHDFDGTEVRALAGNASVLYAAVNKMSPPRIGYPKIPTKKKKAGTPIKGKRPKKRVPPVPRKGAKKGSGGVFRIWATGAAQQLHGLKTSYFTALELTPLGDVYAAEGKQGKVYFLKKDGGRATVADVKERQVLALNITGKTPCLATGDAASFYAVTRTGAGRYVSKAFDAGSASVWGRLRWRVRGKVRIESRSGNTAKADKGWSRWQPMGRSVREKGGGSALVLSPAGRYMQYRLTWSGRSLSVVDHVRLYYRPLNRRGKVKSLEVAEQISQDKKTKVKKASWLSKVTDTAPVSLKIKWKVKNPDGDPLVYRVHYREENDPTWRKLGGGIKQPLTKTSVTWKTANLPDGRYLIRVVASDERANPSNRTMTHQRISQAILIDHSKPAIKGLTIRNRFVGGMAVDAYSRITGVQYSLDGENWKVVGATDGIFDQTAESFSFRITARLKRGVHPLLLRVFDAAGNTRVIKKRVVIR